VCDHCIFPGIRGVDSSWRRWSLALVVFSHLGEQSSGLTPAGVSPSYVVTCLKDQGRRESVTFCCLKLGPKQVLLRSKALPSLRDPDLLLCFADLEAFHSVYRASVINRASCQPQLTLEELLPASTPPQALDLLKQLLVFNPEKRITAEEALEHPYVQRFHCAAKEPALDYNVTLPLADDVQLSVAEYRNRVYELILEWKASNQAQKQHLQREQSGSTDASSPLKAHCLMQGETQPLPSRGSPPLWGVVAASQRRVNEARNACPKPKFSSTVCSPTVNAAAQSKCILLSKVLKV
ncbi:mitogen-activated protein kinase 15-like, partial [Python bivittatus]|uniref:Mitogen-activated protein kinase 15-like n=1 Tax=Python bivittatus TaxID=176946 RepID=A0A9F2RFN8_PYTBI